MTPQNKGCEKSGCRLCQIQGRAELLRGVESDVIEVFERQRSSRLYPRGTILYHQGSLGGGIYCVSSGLIKIFRTDRAGLVQIVRLVGAGEFLGFRRAFQKQPSASTAQVISPAVVCTIPAPSVVAAMAHDPQLGWNMLRAQSAALERTESHLVKLVGLSSPGRVVSMLLEHSTREPVDMMAPLTREEMAQLAGTSIESVSRLLQEMARRGYLQLRGRSVFVLDRPALEQFVEGEYRS